MKIVYDHYCRLLSNYLLCLIFFHDRDGASVNMGGDKGIGVRMMRALGRSIVIHHCAGTVLFEDQLIKGF